MASVWTCPRCKRRFTRVSQRHACGAGDRGRVLANRPREIVDLYEALESFAKTLGKVEFVTRERYVLLRTDRIFTDLVVQPDSLRIAVHLPRKVKNPLFLKVVAGPRHATHVARIRETGELETLKPLIREAHEYSKRA